MRNTIRIQFNAVRLKAVRRLPKWAASPNGNAHKLIKAFLFASGGRGSAQKSTMRLICSDATHPETYIENFDTWLADLKQEGGNASGKFFEESEDGVVSVWEPVRPTFDRLKREFLG